MNSRNFFAELKRRNVYRVAIAYGVVAWLLIQIATSTFPVLEIPNWAIKLVIALVVLGFPVALLLAWAFELTPEGVQRTGDADSEPLSTRRRRGRLFWSVVAIGCVAAALLTFHYVGSPPRTISTVQKGPVTGARKSLAVLPFENLSEDKANSYFADGMQDEIITRLAKIGDLKVISRTSTQSYRTRPERISEIARQLGVGHVVEGSVQKIGDRVRINVQLVEAQTDDHLWAELYDRNLTDIFAVQSEVATAIAKSLRAKLSPREQNAVAEKPTANLAAYDAYLRGLDFFGRPGDTAGNNKQAAAAFEEAVRLDPQFAQGWAALARANAGLYFLGYDDRPARKEAARTAAETATRLAPRAAETLLANAYYRYHAERDYDGARVLFEEIQREVPSSSEVIEALAKIARRQSRWTESLHFWEQAASLNPRDPSLYLNHAVTLWALRKYSETEQMLDRALTISPNDPNILVNKANLYQTIGDLTAARAALDSIPAAAKPEGATDLRVIQLTLERRHEEALHLLEQKLGENPPTAASEGGDDQGWLGWLRSLAGDKAGATQAYLEGKRRLQLRQQEQPENYFAAGAMAFCEAGLGNKEAALREAERAVSILPASRDPLFGPKSEENLAAVEAQVGEPERAIARIERLLTTPYGELPLTQATLRLDPVWDPLRQHPRFKAIVEGPEPKTIYN